jgi:tape measure domain-containing protein
MSQTTELLLRIRQQGGQELVKLQGSLKNLGQQTSATNVNFKELAQELKKVQATSTQSINNLKGYANAWKEIANSVDVTSDEFRIARAESTALEARLKTFQGSQTAVANNFRNIASAANQAAAAMRTTTGLMRDPLTGAYSGTAGVTQYGAPIGPALPPDVAGRIAQQQREAASQAARDARRRIKLQERASYMGMEYGFRDPTTGAIIGRSRTVSEYGEMPMATQYGRPIGPMPATARRGLPLSRIARTGGAVAAAGIFGGPEGALGAGIGAVFGGPAGAAIGGAIGAQVSMLRKAIGDTGTYLAEIKKLNIALAGVSKSQKDFNGNIENISKLSKQFLIPLKDTTQQYTKLQASVAGAGMTSQETEKVFKGIAAAVTATGGSTEDLNSALRATSQVFSKGKVSAEELRQQIGERLPGAFTIFADSIGKTPQELDKALENGEVTLEDFIKFSEELFKRYGNTANLIAEAPENAGKRLQMALDNIAIQIGRFAGPIGAGFQAIATSIVEGLTPAFEAFANLLDLPKVAAKERLAQIKRQIPQKELDIQTYRGMAQLLGASGGMFNIQADVAEMSLKQLRGEQATLEGVVKGIGKGLGDNVYKPGGALDKGGKKKKEIKDITESELFLYNKIEDALDSGNQLQAEFLQSSLKLRQVQQQLDKGEIKANNAAKERRQAQGQIYRAIEAQRESMNAVSQQYVDQKESVKEQMQALEIQYGLTTQKQAEEIAFEQQMDDLRKAAKFTTLAKDVEELIAKLRNARQAAESFGNQISKSFAETVKQSGELAQNLGATLGNAFLGLGDQLADFVTTGKMQFADFARSILNDLAKIFIKFAMFQALKAIVPSGSAFGKFLGFADGGIMTSNGSMPLRRYANGGIATSPQIAMFGEGSRPEAYVPLPDGRSIPVKMKGGGDVGNIVVNVDASGSAVQGNEPDANKLGEALGIAVRQELIRQKRPGGLLA